MFSNQVSIVGDKSRRRCARRLRRRRPTETHESAALCTAKCERCHAVSDASSEDWATIGVKVLSIALVPQGGGANVTVYTAPTPAPVVNLAELDQIAEILGNVSVPVGTYSGAVLTISANTGDVLLTTCGRSGNRICALPRHDDSRSRRYKFSTPRAAAPISLCRSMSISLRRWS